MSKAVSSSAALPIVHVVLRILVVVNWFAAAALLALLLATPYEQWIMSAFKLSPGPDTDRLIMGMRFIVLLGLASIPLNYLVLRRLHDEAHAHDQPVGVDRKSTRPNSSDSQ